MSVFLRPRDYHGRDRDKKTAMEVAIEIHGDSIGLPINMVKALGKSYHSMVDARVEPLQRNASIVKRTTTAFLAFCVLHELEPVQTILLMETFLNKVQE